MSGTAVGKTAPRTWLRGYGRAMSNLRRAAVLAALPVLLVAGCGGSKSSGGSGSATTTTVASTPPPNATAPADVAPAPRRRGWPPRAAHDELDHLLQLQDPARDQIHAPPGRSGAGAGDPQGAAG